MPAYNLQPAPRRPVVPTASISAIEQGCHTPHNVAYPDELRLLLNILDSHGPLSYAELTSETFIEQVMSGVFGKYHGKPQRCFNDDSTPPDFASIVSALGSMELAQSFVRGRAANYQALLAGEITLKEVMETPCKPASSWKRVWVECKGRCAPRGRGPES